LYQSTLVHSLESSRLLRTLLLVLNPINKKFYSHLLKTDCLFTITMKFTSTTALIISTLAATELNNASAFAPQSGIPSSVAFHNTLSNNNNNARITNLNALPGGGSEFFDLHQSLSSLSHIFDPATSTLLSDAAAAAVEETKSGGLGGLWESYLELFKAFFGIGSFND